MVRTAENKRILDALDGEKETVTDHKLEVVMQHLEYETDKGKYHEKLMKIITKK